MIELSYEAAVVNLWIATLLWLLASGYAVLEATPEFMKNRRAYLYWHRSHDNKFNEIQSRGDCRRSSWFLVGFVVAFLLGVQSVGALAYYGPPPDFDASFGHAALIYVFVFLLVCFWRGKHADRRTSVELERMDRESRT